MGIIEFCENNILVFDGAMGTMLQKRGLASGQRPEIFNVTNPEIIEAVHEEYFKAGANVATANTFGANARNLSRTGYTVEQVITAAVKSAKAAACRHNGFTVLDIGPIGELLEPMGTLSISDAYELFKEQALIGKKCGVDAVIIETMTDLQEIRLALLAVKENTDLPVFCTMSFEENMRTFIGVELSAMAVVLDGLGADFIGINCSLGPSQILPMVIELVKWTNKPIIIQPNAGLPSVVSGKTVYNMTPSEFALGMKAILEIGINAIGGCCGTSPDFIKEVKETAKIYTPTKRAGRILPSVVCSSSKTVLIDRVRIIGERINPTGKKKLKQAFLDKDMDYIAELATEQTDDGADILDVNAGMPEIDEECAMVAAVEAIQAAVNTPLQIDSTNPETIEAALRIYNGKAVVNSVNGDIETLDTILPLVKKYGAAVVGLTLDETGIPETAEKRCEVAKRIVERAAYYGIPKNNVFIDCLTLTASMGQTASEQTLRAVALVKERLGVKTVLGISNISFGLPAREKLNLTFLAMALNSGLDMPIINPCVREMADAVCCFHMLKGIDAGAAGYITRFGVGEKTEKREFNAQNGDILYCIKRGLKDEAKACCLGLLEKHDSLTVVNQFLIPALDEVGKEYETGVIFLPQLLMSAEAAKAAFEAVKQKMSVQKNSDGIKQQKIVLATVKGDIHDIGKNIVKVVLENYGFDVIDLGKDVAVGDVVNAAVRHNAGLVGLSALMTTTLDSMELTIKALKDALPDIKIMVGGAVLTESFARQIGADFYSKDAMTAAAVAKKCFNVM